jgi:decaprenylphospho-beta-D-erythro-pentofuranosid-2-ulose 2-reductase
VLLGGDSEIGQAIAGALGATSTVLAARRPGAGERVRFEAADLASHAATFDEVFADGDVDVVVAAFGVLGDQAEAERDPAAAAEVAHVNYTASVSALTHAAERLRAQGHGALVVLSSVAAQRARRSNYVYGSSKAGLDAFTSGLQLALADSGVQVLLVRPGFVRTKMTAHLSAAPFAVDADAVARAVAKALREGDDVIWVPALLRYVMWAIRVLPRSVVARL